MHLISSLPTILKEPSNLLNPVYPLEISLNGKTFTFFRIDTTEDLTASLYSYYSQ
jgi:hypothetical protein